MLHRNLLYNAQWVLVVWFIESVLTLIFFSFYLKFLDGFNEYVSLWTLIKDSYLPVVSVKAAFYLPVYLTYYMIKGLFREKPFAVKGHVLLSMLVTMGLALLIPALLHGSPVPFLFLVAASGLSMAFNYRLISRAGVNSL